MTSKVDKKIELKKNERKYVIKKREMKNYESYQQAMILGLLNQYCGMTIEQPTKVSKVTISSPKVITLHFDTEDINIQRIAETQCKLILEEEIQKRISNKTAMRRYEKNKKIFIQNFLFDICLEKGICFNSFLSRKSNKSQQIERISSIHYNINSFITQNQLISKGKAINTYLLSLIQSDKRITIPKCDNTLLKHII
ncbi:TATA-binding protein-associated phosphoprotein [Entamoeba marina]